MENKEKKLRFGLIMAVYLLGIFMGALDTGIVTPARTVIQDSLGIDDNTGIWMITIYTLAYAASIPVMGKLADRMGRRTIYLVSILLFGGGSLACGLSHSFDSFTMLLAARAVQAIGGGGIVPIANAEFGTTFPPEKRGMALGMVGGVYGIANIFGASVGSLVMDIFGTQKWEFIFYVNVPIAVFILIAGYVALPNTKDKAVSRIDVLGNFILVVMVLCIMYGLKNIDFFAFKETIRSTDVYPFLIGFVVLLPVFILVERRAEDPVLNLRLFANLRIVVTLVVSIITGIVMMGVIFVPQLCENAMEVPAGSGGYFVIALGACAGLGAPFSGKLTDKFGPKMVLGAGFLASIAGSLVIIYRTTVDPSVVNVFAGLMLIGFGIGFVMGAPLNYMILWEVEKKEANSALATLALVRSLGTVVAPAIMVGFIAHAGLGMSDNIMEIMPDKIHVPSLPYAQELTEAMKDQNIEDMPDFTEMKTIKIDMGDTENSDFEIPDKLLKELENSDVTTITAGVKHIAEYFFDENAPKMQKDMEKGLKKGIRSMDTAIADLDGKIRDLKEARSGIFQGASEMDTAIAKQRNTVQEMETGRSGVEEGLAGVGEALNKMNASYEKMQKAAKAQEKAQKQSKGKSSRNAMENPAKAEKEMKKQIAALEKKQNELEASKKEMTEGIRKLNQAISELSAKQGEMNRQSEEMGTAISGMEEGKAELVSTKKKMVKLKKAIPGAFEKAKKSYMEELDKKSPKIRKVFQDTLNVGFRQIFIMNLIACTVGILLLVLYRRKRMCDELLIE